MIFQVYFARYIQGPLDLGLKKSKILLRQRPEYQVLSDPPRKVETNGDIDTHVGLHEMYTPLDYVFRKIDVQLIDELLIISRGPAAIYSSPYFKKSVYRTVKSLDSKASRNKSWKVYYMTSILRKKLGKFIVIEPLPK